MNPGDTSSGVPRRNIMYISRQPPNDRLLVQMAPSFEPFKPISHNQLIVEPMLAAAGDACKRQQGLGQYKKTLVINPAPDVRGIEINLPQNRSSPTQQPHPGQLREFKGAYDLPQQQPAKPATVRTRSMTQASYEQVLQAENQSPISTSDSELLRIIQRGVSETKHKFLVIKCRACSLSIPGGLFVDHFYSHNKGTIHRQTSAERLDRPTQKQKRPLPEKLPQPLSPPTLENSQVELKLLQQSPPAQRPITAANPRLLNVNYCRVVGRRPEEAAPLESHGDPASLDNKFYLRPKENAPTASKESRVPGRLSEVVLAPNAREPEREKSTRKLSLIKNARKPNVSGDRDGGLDSRRSPPKVKPFQSVGGSGEAPRPYFRPHPHPQPMDIDYSYNYLRETPIRMLESPLREPSPAKPKIPRNILAQASSSS